MKGSLVIISTRNDEDDNKNSNDNDKEQKEKNNNTETNRFFAGFSISIGFL